MTTIGFTGTRRGMTPEQKEALEDDLRSFEVDAFHQGDCKGSDEEALAILCRIEPEAVTHSHPPDVDAYRAFTQCNYTHPPKPYLDRNRDIVDACEVLIATPDGPPRMKSGTWATVRYAARKGLERRIIMPDGTLTVIPA